MPHRSRNARILLATLIGIVGFVHQLCRPAISEDQCRQCRRVCRAADHPGDRPRDRSDQELAWPVFQVTTIFLLLAAVAAHEGAICVILAAPLVYAVAHGVAALVIHVRTRATGPTCSWCRC